MSKVYNIAATVGQASTYVTAVLTTLVAILCILLGFSLVTTTHEGLVVQGKVTAVTPGCATPGGGHACTVTAGYILDDVRYEATFPTNRMTLYSVGDIIDMRVNPATPKIAEEEFPKQAVGWTLLASAIVSVYLAITLTQFANDSKNFAAGAGVLTFLHFLLPF